MSNYARQCKWETDSGVGSSSPQSFARLLFLSQKGSIFPVIVLVFLISLWWVVFSVFFFSSGTLAVLVGFSGYFPLLRLFLGLSWVFFLFLLVFLFSFLSHMPLWEWKGSSWRRRGWWRPFSFQSCRVQSKEKVLHPAELLGVSLGGSSDGSLLLLKGRTFADENF